MAIVMTGTPVHPVYYAKKELDNVAGRQTATIQFYGATNGSARNLVIVSSARASFSWLKQNLANDGNPAWDTNRTTKPSDVPVISPSHDVTTRWATPGILEALIPGRMQGHGGTEEVPG